MTEVCDILAVCAASRTQPVMPLSPGRYAISLTAVVPITVPELCLLQSDELGPLPMDID